jgi:hypothetical protein
MKPPTPKPHFVDSELPLIEGEDYEAVCKKKVKREIRASFGDRLHPERLKGSVDGEVSIHLLGVSRKRSGKLSRRTLVVDGEELI